MKSFPSALAACCALISGCGGGTVHQDTWLAIHDSDTITVADASRAWQAFSDEQRSVFMQSDSSGKVLVRSLAIRGILAAIAREEGYLADPSILAMGESWLRTEASIALQQSMMISFETMTASDRDYCRENSTGVLSLSASVDGTAFTDLGIFRRVDLPPDLAAMMDSAAGPGFETGWNGLVFRIDSTATVDPAQLSLTLQPDGSPDSSSIWTINEGRSRFLALSDKIRIDSEYHVRIDTAAVDRLVDFYSGRAPMLPGDTVLTSDLVDRTALQTAGEIAFFQTRFPLHPDSRDWILNTLDNIVMQSYRASLLASREPAVYDSLEGRASSYELSLAVDYLRRDSVLSKVSVGEQDIQEAFESLERPDTVPERRVLLAVLMPADAGPRYEAAVAAGHADAFVSGLPRFSLLMAGDSSTETPPLRESDLPPGHGVAVFALSPGDSSWVGPLELGGGMGSAFYRVLRVLPEHPATIEDLRPELEVDARTRLEAEATEQWLRRLAESHHLRYDLRALDRLPSDPGRWGSIR